MSDESDKPGPGKDIPDYIPLENKAATPTYIASAMEEGFSLDGALSKASKELSGKKKKDVAGKYILYGAGGVIFLMLILIVYSCQPAKGGMAYGICATFLEQIIPYPGTIRHTAVEGSRTAVRIYYTHVDPFGEYKQEMMECKFGPDPKMGMRVLQVTKNRQLVDQQKVNKFNLSLPTVMASEPDQTMPPNRRYPLAGNEKLRTKEGF